MCPGHVPGSRSDTVSERSTTLAPASDAKSKAPPLPGTRRTSAATQGGSRTAPTLKTRRNILRRPSAVLPDRRLSRPRRSVAPRRPGSQRRTGTRGATCSGCGRSTSFWAGRPSCSERLSESLLVASEDHWHLGPLDKGARDDVGVHSLVFDLVRKAPRCQVGEADPERVAVRLLADVADDYVFDGGRLRLIDAEDAEASDHVRVHPRPRVVLSQSIDVEDVYVRDGQARHQLHVLGEELGLALVDL